MRQVEDDGLGLGGQARGTGLGGRLVRAMSEALGGEGVSEGDRGAGTRVEVRFPLQGAYCAASASRRKAPSRISSIENRATKVPA